MSAREDIEAAAAAIEALVPARREAESRLAKFTEAHKALVAAKQARDTFLTESRARIDNINQRISYYGKTAAILDDSGCPHPEEATCNFLKNAVTAKGTLDAPQGRR